MFNTHTHARTHTLTLTVFHFLYLLPWHLASFPPHHLLLCLRKCRDVAIGSNHMSPLPGCVNPSSCCLLLTLPSFISSFIETYCVLCAKNSSGYEGHKSKIRPFRQVVPGESHPATQALQWRVVSCLWAIPGQNPKEDQERLEMTAVWCVDPGEQDALQKWWVVFIAASPSVLLRDMLVRGSRWPFRLNSRLIILSSCVSSLQQSVLLFTL